jgi:hypothetical protein
MGHGGKRPGAGRKPGATEAEIKQAREAIAKFCDMNSAKIQGWFDHVAARDPDKALEILYKYMEFHVPKLARSESKSEIDHNHYIYDTAIRGAPNAAEQDHTSV